MKKKWAAVSVVAVVLVGIPPTARANSADATSAIREKYKEWLAAYDAKNLAGTINIFAEDAISTFAGAKDAGIEEIRASYKKSLAANGPKRTWKPVEMEIDGDGDLAYALADWQLIETQPDGSGSVRLTNRSVDVLRREGETWKIVRSFTIPADKRPVKLSCEIRLPSISPGTTAVVLGVGGLGHFGIQVLKALSCARASGSTEREADVLATYGIALIHNGQTGAGLVALDGAVANSAGAHGARVRFRRGGALWVLGRHEDALADLKSAVAVLRRL